MIRTMKREDVPQCIELGRRQHAESKLNYLNLDMEKIKYGFLSAVDHPTRRVFVIDIDGKIVGLAGVSLEHYEYNYDYYVMDHFYYILPEHRKGLLAFKLFKAVHRWGVENRALEIQFNYAHGDDNDRMGKLLNKLGYKKYCDQYKKLMI